jgi:ribonuclease E
LTPTSPSEVAEAVADFDGGSPGETLPEVQPEPIAPAAEPQASFQVSHSAAEQSSPPEPESEKSVTRRSTVREKVSFTTSAPPAEATSPAVHESIEASAPAQAEPAPASETAEAQPRKAGWWSRRFGSGQ